MNVLGVLGFALSVVALLWNLALTIVRAPRIRVEIDPKRDVNIHVGEAPSSPEAFRVIVVNRGSEPITIKNIGLRSPQRPELPLDYETYLRNSLPVPDPTDQSLPARIEGRDCLVWTYGEDMLGRYGIGTLVIAYADRYKFIRIRGPWTKRTESDPIERGGLWQ
jgi:hypothetical protein